MSDEIQNEVTPEVTPEVAPEATEEVKPAEDITSDAPVVGSELPVDKSEVATEEVK